MKNHKTIKKFISLILTAAYILAAVSVSTALAESTAQLSDSGYSALDLSLTKTVYNAIGQTGQVKAAVIQEMDVSMYATPYYSNTSSTDSEKYYAVKVDKDTHDYLVKSGTAKKTFTARPQRVMLAASQLVCTSDNTAVATVNSDGVITITGYGVANILVTYNGGTPADSSDDVSGAVTIFATKPDGNIITIDNTLQWTDENHSALEMRVNKITDVSLSDIYEAGNKRFSASNLTSAFDPIGNDSSPLSIQVTGNSNLTTRNNYVSADTLAGGDASLIAQEYASNSRVMIQGWYYESGKGASDDAVYPKISFGYCGTTDISSSINDGRRAWQLGNKKGGYYRIWGGDANTYSSAANNTFFKKDTTPSGVTTTSASATKNLSGIDTAIKATKGWHQFALTVEPSLINPGTDYALTKVYLDGKLLTSQDIYIGDIEIGKRRVYIFLPKLGDATGYTADTAGGGNDYLHYKGLTIARFDNSQTIVDSIPADGAQNVP
ncbi:MAG: hypothetical protein IKV63_02415, partial [Clostridia bacterium]|nr:hypothetical protein [Clostridia bacterium]